MRPEGKFIITISFYPTNKHYFNHRSVFERAHKTAKSWEEKEARLLLLEAWTEFEGEHGDGQTRDKVKEQMPKKVKKRRKRLADDGSDAGWEEYFDYIFPSDAAAMPHLKFLEKAKKWKKISNAPVAPEPSSTATTLSEEPSSHSPNQVLEEESSTRKSPMEEAESSTSDNVQEEPVPSTST